MIPSFVGSMVAERSRSLPPAPSAGTDQLDLSGEFLSSSTSSAVRSATIHAAEQHECDHYTRRPGIAPLCRAVASSLSAAGLPLSENQVTICGSVAEARYVSVRALAAGKDLYLPAPAPAVYQAELDFGGASVHHLDADGELPAVQGGVLILSNPHPLTGQLMAGEQLQRLAAWAVASNLTVIADESGGPIRPGAPFVRVATLPGMAERTLTIGSFAEVPGLGAWQVSWIAGTMKAFASVRDLKQSITICTAAASQFAALAATTSAAPGEAAAQYVERMETLTGLLDRHQIDYLEPDTLAFVVARVPNNSTAAAAFRSAGILVGDGALLGNPGTIRIAVPSGFSAHALNAMDSALTALKDR